MRSFIQWMNSIPESTSFRPTQKGIYRLEHKYEMSCFSWMYWPTWRYYYYSYWGRPSYKFKHRTYKLLEAERTHFWTQNLLKRGHLWSHQYLFMGWIVSRVQIIIRIHFNFKSLSSESSLFSWNIRVQKMLKPWALTTVCLIESPAEEQCRADQTLSSCIIWYRLRSFDRFRNNRT